MHGSVFLSLHFSDQNPSLACRSDCFSSDIFVGCMDTLLVEKEARMEAANLVGDMHSHARF